MPVQDTTPGPPAESRGTPPPDLFVPLTEQLGNVRRWNEDRGWGFRAKELNAIDLTPRQHVDPLVVDLIAVYLDDISTGSGAEMLDGVRRTCRELWTIAAEHQPTSWYWDWVRDRYDPRPMPVRLLPGIIHWPGVRRMTVDLGAHWIPGQHVRPSSIRGPASAHAEILAAAAHFPRWARAMDGVSVPYIWLSGYQVTHPEGSAHLRLPGLAFVGYRKTLSFTVDRIDRAHSGWASPVV
ncbi:MAG: hypothetical protein M3446_02375 [Actinomycetota bacterium]|nr:hypothetical protein [Actinomycetota bacterium]